MILGETPRFLFIAGDFGWVVKLVHDPVRLMNQDSPSDAVAPRW